MLHEQAAPRGSYAICSICGRALKDPVSVGRGMGPMCAGTRASGRHYHSTPEEEFEIDDEPLGDDVVYRGYRLGEFGHLVVTAGDRRLLPDLSLTFRRHSPNGFEWGYSGSGPAQLALAILLDWTRNSADAISQYQAFKEKFIAPAPKEGFRITGAEIRAWLRPRMEG